MIRRKFRKGDFVKFAAEAGSVGKILMKNHYGNFYVRWVYGRDVAGEPMYSSTSSCSASELRLISRADYERVHNGKGWEEKVSLKDSRALPCEAFA